MYTAKVRNSRGEVLQLTNNEAMYQVVWIHGLNPPKATVNTTPIATMDGAKKNSSRLGMRNIVIMLKLNGDVEEVRQRLYQFFPTKDDVRFYFENERRNVYIDGVVETCEVDLFSNAEAMQISIICPQPYFRQNSDVAVDASSVSAAFEFPFSIELGVPIAFSILEVDRTTVVENDSDSSTGVEVVLTINDDCNSIRVQNTTTGEYLYLVYAFKAGDVVRIDTHEGQKRVRLIRGGQTVSIFYALQAGSKFFQLAVGQNTFGYLVDGGGYEERVGVVFVYYYTYRGV